MRQQCLGRQAGEPKMRKKVQACTESQRQEGIQYWIKVASPRTVGKMGILIYGVGHPDDDLGNRSLGI